MPIKKESTLTLSDLSGELALIHILLCVIRQL